jgi:hypothetical protein
VGFGAHWGDLPVLQTNGFQVVSVANPQNLFRMLSAQRFDYIPRGVAEVQGEIQREFPTYPNLAVVPGVGLYYPNPIYFYAGTMTWNWPTGSLAV